MVSLDGFMADDDGVGPLFDWLGNGDAAWSFPGSDGESLTTQASADFMLDLYADTAPFTFVDGVERAIAAAKEFAGDRVVDVAAGQIGGQALRLGLIDRVVVNQVPVAFGSGRPFFATGALAEPLRLENPTTIVQGDRVTHLLYDVSR